MYRKAFLLTTVVAIGVLLLIAGPSRAEILNDDEYGWLEVLDLSVIEDAADIFMPGSLRFNIGHGAPINPGDEIVIYYHGWNEHYVTLIDYSPDRKVKPLVINVPMNIRDGLDGSYSSVIGDSLGMEYVLLLVTSVPLTDERLELIALSPNEIETGEDIFIAGVSGFNVVGTGRDPGVVQQWADSSGYDHGVEMIGLEEFAIYIDYPLNRYPYNPWSYMYLYPYAKFRPAAYTERYGPFSKTWYVFPTGQTIESNLWDYAYTGWIEDGIMVIPPGGYYQGTFRTDDPYASYWMRVLPYIIRENTSYLSLQMEINGSLVEPTFDITGAIGWGEYWTTDPFAYYSLDRILRRGDNTFRLYWPEDAGDDLRIQMMDLVPTEVIEEEIDEATDAVEAEGELSEDGEVNSD